MCVVLGVEGFRLCFCCQGFVICMHFILHCKAEGASLFCSKLLILLQVVTSAVGGTLSNNPAGNALEIDVRDT